MGLFSRTKYTERPPRKEVEVDGVLHADADMLEKRRRLGWKRGVAIFLGVCCAATVSAWGIWKSYEALVITPEHERQMMLENLAREVEKNYPLIIDYIELGDAEMHAALEAAGNTVYFLEAYEEEPEDSIGFDLYRLPDTVDEKTAATILKDGISAQKPYMAALFLNGSWRFTVYRYLTCAVRLQYADYEATNPQEAIEHALDLQGWNDPETFTDSGVDANGNTFQAGTLVVDGKHYEWRISTVTIKEMYGIEFPEGGMFVGIRLTKILL